MFIKLAFESDVTPFSPWSIHFSQTKWCSLIDNYFRHKTPCGIRKLTAAFVSKIGVFSRFSWSLDFDAKMAEFPLPVLQIWRSRKRVAIQIQLMNIHVSEYKYYCLHLVPKFGDLCDRQNWRLHPTDDGLPFPRSGCPVPYKANIYIIWNI